MAALNKYDEKLIQERLAKLNDMSVAAFTACCAQRTLEIVKVQVAEIGSAHSRQMGGIVDRIWRAIEGEQIELASDKDILEALYPDVEHPDFDASLAYLQHAAGAALYAIDYYLSRAIHDAVWSARQVYDAADYAEGRMIASGVKLPSGGFVARWPKGETPHSFVVAEAVEGVASDIDRLADGDVSCEELRMKSQSEGKLWANRYASLA